MKRFYLVLTVFMCVSLLYSKEKEGWNIDVNANVTVTQNAYSDSWIGEEKGTISWASKLDFVASRKLTPWYNHRNTLKLNYGQTKTQDDQKNWASFVKSADLIDFETLQRFDIGRKTEPFVAVRLISQFTDNSDSLHTHYGNPLAVTESFGASRTLVHSKALLWDARLGGAVQQAVNRYFYEENKAHRSTRVVNNLGFEVVSEMKAVFREGLVDYKGLLTVFQAVLSSEKENKTRSGTPDWKYPDVNWENIFSVNLTKYVMVNMTVQLLYDREKHQKARLKEVAALGLSYRFSSTPKTVIKK